MLGHSQEDPEDNREHGGANQNGKDSQGKDPAHALASSTASTVDVWGDVALWLAGVALAFGVGIAAKTVFQAQAAARAQATFRYLERFTTPRIRRIIERSNSIISLDEADRQPRPQPSWRQKVLDLFRPPSAPADPSTGEDARAQARRRYQAASVNDQLNIGEMFDLYEEVSHVFLRGLLDDEIFVEQIAPELVYRWRLAHWLINYYRERPDGTLDVGIYSKWQTAYGQMVRRHIAYEAVEDSDPEAGDYALLPEPRPLLWPDRVRWTGFRPPR